MGRGGELGEVNVGGVGSKVFGTGAYNYSRVRRGAVYQALDLDLYLR